jgi:hypothetical protein
MGFKGKNRLSHVQFQEEIARNLLRGPGAILRQRRPRPPKASSNPHNKSVSKGTYRGHEWGKLDSYRRCQVCNPPKKRGPKGSEQKVLQELPVNAPNSAKSSRSTGHRTVHYCIKYDIPICHNSHCWGRHLPNP